MLPVQESRFAVDKTTLDKPAADEKLQVLTEEAKTEAKDTRRGFKIVDHRLQSRDNFQYTIGKTASVTGRAVMCNHGLHFCYNAANCITYSSSIEAPYRYLRVIPMSEAITWGDKSVTLDLFVESEMTATEFLAEARKDFASGVGILPQLLLETGIMECDIATMQYGLELCPLAREIPHFLGTAAALGRIDSMQFLIHGGFTQFSTALDLAVANNRLAMVEFLLNLPSVIIQDQKANGLASAARMGAVEIARVLIAAGASNINEALVIAARCNMLPMVKFLLEAGATAIHRAVFGADIGSEVFQYLTALPSFNVDDAEKAARDLGYLNDVLAHFFACQRETAANLSAFSAFSEEPLPSPGNTGVTNTIQ